jgi:predicted  nucleic acid-binding Zn-ribbon protein
MAEVEGSSPSVPIFILSLLGKDSDVVDVTILAQIKKLVALQKIDGQIYTFRKDLENKPALLKHLGQQFETKKVRLNQLEEKYKVMQVSRKTLEVELKSQEDAMVKANAQLSQLKTNKEYQAKLTEIEGFKAIKSQVEEKILMSYDETDAVKAQIDQEKAELAKEEAQYLQAKKEIEATVKEIEEKVRSLTVQRDQFIDGIDRTHLQRYERILANKEGLAIVPLQNGSCGGCFMNVPPQVVNEIKLHEKLIYCEMCARILYLEEEI